MGGKEVDKFQGYAARVWRVPSSWGQTVCKGQLPKRRSDRLEEVGDRVIAVSQASFDSGGERNIFWLRMGILSVP